MRPAVSIAVSIFFLLISSCASLNVKEIKNLERKTFEPLQVKPDVDFSMKRIDIVRRYENKKEFPTDTVKKNEPVPYSFLGFDLGNDLFCDLNSNLSLRLDRLLGVPDDHYRLEVINMPKKDKMIWEYSYMNDTACHKWTFNKKRHYDYHKVVRGDTLMILYKKRKRLTVVRTDTAWYIREPLFTKAVIRKKNDNYWYYRKDKPWYTSRLQNDTVILGKTYLITLADNNRMIKVFRYRKKKPWLFYNIIKGDNTMYIYNRYNRGKKIEMSGDTLLVWHNKRLWAKYIFDTPPVQ